MSKIGRIAKSGLTLLLAGLMPLEAGCVSSGRNSEGLPNFAAHSQAEFNKPVSSGIPGLDIVYTGPNSGYLQEGKKVKLSESQKRELREKYPDILEEVYAAAWGDIAKEIYGNGEGKAIRIPLTEETEGEYDIRILELRVAGLRTKDYFINGVKQKREIYCVKNGKSTLVQTIPN